MEGPDAATRRATWLAYVIGAFGLAMFAQANFIVPLRSRELGASFEVIGLLVGAGAIAPAILAVVLGATVDRLGPRRAFIAGTSGCVILALLGISVTDYRWFFLLQPALGLCINLSWLASQSYITGFGRPQDVGRNTGRFSLFSNLGQMIGPLLIGSVGQVLELRWAFMVLALYSLAFAAMGVYLREAPRRPSDQPGEPVRGIGFRSAMRIATYRGVQVVLLLTFVRLWTSFVYNSFFPVFLVDNGFPVGLVGSVMATSGLVAAVMALAAGRISERAGEARLAVVGLGCASLALVLAPHAAAMPFAYIVPVLMGIGSGVSLPMLLSLLGRAVPVHERGVALGLRGMVNQAAATSAPVVVGAIIGAVGMLGGFTLGGLAGAMVLVSANLLAGRDR